jgi:hypothetical protein
MAVSKPNTFYNIDLQEFKRAVGDIDIENKMAFVGFK